MLTFEKPDPVRFPTIQLAYDVLKMGGGAPAALNGANEALVELFLKECISFVGVIETLQKVVSDLAHYRPELSKKNQHPYLSRIDTVQDAIKADQWGRDFVEIWIDRKIE
jgi:1-deoxy-D-xylulose-5-phosphate reductoisomerase